MVRYTTLLLVGLLLVSCGGPDLGESPAVYGTWAAPVFIPLNTKQNGEACTAGSECISGNCVDDVCCDSTCAGVCMHCALSGLEGNCRYVFADQDPDAECPGDPPCGSQCDGSGGCSYASSGTSCGACAQCDGGGNCNVFQPAGSDPGNVCGICRVCPGDGPDCIPSSAGSDPWDECTAEAPESCGLTGDCDGLGDCAFHPPDTVCQPERCESDVHHPENLCDGQGRCIDAGSDLCLPYVCLDAVVCRSDCVSDLHCAGVSHCESGECVAYLTLGEPCSLDSACISGECTDDVCCEYACDGPCEACDFAQDLGSCLPIADGEDPDNECPGVGLCGGVCNSQKACRFTADTVKCSACTSCDGAGSCGLLASPGSDPFDDCAPCWACSGVDASCRLVPDGADTANDCPDSPAQGCGPAGTCDGAGGCQLWPQGTVCAPAACTDGLLQPADLCDGLGSCIESGEVSCNGYACLGDDACRTDCQNDDDCLSGVHCDNAACAPDLADGLPCSRNAQCISPNCIDGVCCATRCDGICMRCDLTGTEGTCAPVPEGLDPDGECPGDGSCGGACNGVGACAFPGSETACASCALCDGSGNCSVWLEADSDPNDVCGRCRVCPGDGPDCVRVEAGEDPLEECGQQSESTCGQDGSCDGQGNCHLWAFGTLCGSQSCTGDTLRRAPTCNGSGNCVEQDSISCAPYICEGDNCAGPEGLHHITVEDAPGGNGQRIGSRALTCDDTLILYAIGRDAAGGFLGDVLAIWRVEGWIGTIPSGPSSSATFDPTTPGNGQVVASFYDPSVTEGATDVLAIAPGAAAGLIPLTADPDVLPADGLSTSTITGGPVHDADDNTVADGTLLTVIASAGSLRGEDDDPDLPGFQRATQAGAFSLVVAAADHPARAVFKAVAAPPGTAQGQVTIYFGDGRPVADAGEDQTVHAGQPVVLDGTGSWDQQDRSLEYSWQQTSGSSVTLAGADTATPTFTAPQVADREVLTFELTVWVDEDQSDPDTTGVTVVGAESGLPMPVIGLDPPEGPAPLGVLLDGSESSASEPATLTNHLWTFSDGEAAIRGETATRTFQEPGGVGVQLTVTDSQGRFNYARAQVSVLDSENHPPALTVTAMPDRGEVPLEVAFSAQAVDPDGQVVVIEWDFGAGYALEGQQQSKTFYRPGFHTVRVRARDDAGLYTVQELFVAASEEDVYPPHILSSPYTAATVRDTYTYEPVAVGSPTFSWSLGKQVGDQLTRAPKGMHVDGVSGTITWKPTGDQAGAVDVTLVVLNDAGSDFQDFTIEVSPSQEPEDGCSCTSGARPAEGAVPLLVCLLVLAGFRRATRPGHHPPFSNKLLSAPQTGQTQSLGRSSKAVPGATPVSGSPFSGSYT